ncbi:MAG TPA: hypothetical protein VF601_15785 [Beijerinckiaceae bacterium]|jgi:hypothetical protein
MAITIRNKKTEETIRRLGQQRGEGPSAVIARLAEAEEKREAKAREREKQERLARIRAFTATLPVPTEEERKAMWEEADRMFDYLYEDEQDEKPE